MRQFCIRAIDLIGREAVRDEMRRRGYENIDRALDSWVQRRKVPDAMKLMMMDLAREADIDLDPQDFDVQPIASEDRSLSGAAA